MTTFFDIHDTHTCHVAAAYDQAPVKNEPRLYTYILNPKGKRVHQSKPFNVEWNWQFSSKITDCHIWMLEKVQCKAIPPNLRPNEVWNLVSSRCLSVFPALSTAKDLGIVGEDEISTYTQSVRGELEVRYGKKELIYSVYEGMLNREEEFEKYFK